MITVPAMFLTMLLVLPQYTWPWLNSVPDTAIEVQLLSETCSAIYAFTYQLQHNYGNC